MGTYIVRVMEREGEFCGVVNEVATGRLSTFADPEALLAALAPSSGPGPRGREGDPGQDAPVT
jgi:hypothetical protein